MAKSQNNIITHGLSGKIGNLLVFSQRNGKTVVSAAPRKPAKESENQKEQRRKFQKAVLYAKAARQQPEYIETAEQHGKTAYNVAIADFLNAPSIESIDLSGYTGVAGNIIRIHATDDFSIKSVSVRITNADGTLVEEGAAQPSSLSYEWLYTATAANSNLDGDKIEIFASDTPGNIAHSEQTM
ncbi:MAG: hypothetical protein LBV41_09670 [Cytophagaceae bacterium]|jgi:hypothetical protein|nr:hypothetical protein [Cytophagaceae bacterium]